MKSRIVSALVILVSTAFLFAQAEQVKGKAKDLKKKVEGQQTNQVDKANPPKK
jgi:cell division protein FtsL